MHSWFPGIGKLLLLTVLIASVIALRIFMPKGFRGWETYPQAFYVFYKYRWAVMLFAFIWFEKTFVDALNDPIRDNLGLDFTGAVYAIEGDAVLHIQRFFLNHSLTLSITFIYVIGYMFLNYFTIVYFAYLDDQELADKLALNYAVIYLLAVPFYLFFPVDVTHTRIPGMEALAYQLGPNWYQFFVGVDPFDNAVPSLHIAIPAGMAILIWRSQRRRGIHDYDRFLHFILALIGIFVFAILYLGIHWIVDIFFGLGIAALGVYIVEGVARDFWDRAIVLEWRIRCALARLRSAPPPPRPTWRQEWTEPLWKKPIEEQRAWVAREASDARSFMAAVKGEDRRTGNAGGPRAGRGRRG